MISGNYGLAVILMALFFQIVTYPLNVRQAKFSMAMRFIGPKQKEIQQKYKGDPNAANAALMDVYKQYGVSPTMGCLPMLLQFPIVIAIFGVLRLPEVFGPNPTFLGMNLYYPDATHTMTSLGWVYWVLPVLSAVTTYWSQKQMTTPGDQNAKTMLYIMPVFIGWISTRFPTGLNIYWVARNIFTIIQQEIFERTIHIAPVNQEGTKGVGK
jgi:YidC/Oxa1 family membrane protein insertase